MVCYKRGLDYSVDSLSSESLVGDESLDLRGLNSGLLAFLLDLSSDNVKSDVVILLQVEELSDVVGSLGTKSSGLLVISQT